MTATIEKPSDGGCVAREPDGWITCRVAQPAIEPMSLDLVSLSARSQTGNMRFAIDNGTTVLIAELRDADGTLSLDDVHRRLFEAAPQPVDEAFQAAVAAVLCETGYAWSAVEEQASQWRAVAEDSQNNRCELTATIVEDGVEIHGRLANWESAPAELSKAAITRFLACAHARVRFARFTLQDDQANAVSFAAADRLDIELPDCVAAVVASHRLVWREVRALADARLARLYLEGINRPTS